MRLIYKKETKKTKAIFILFLVILLSSPLVYALGTKLYCLKKDQIIKFSECNLNIRDFVCDSSTCQICVREISNNVFCPENTNTCNKACVPFEDIEEPPVITLIYPSELYFTEEEKIIEFTFQVDKPNKIRNCSLLINNINVAITNSLIRSGKNKISYFIPMGSYSWFIQCTLRDNTQPINSETRILTIPDKNSPQNDSVDNSSNNPTGNPSPPVQEDTNAGSSGGGSGSSGGSSSSSINLKKSNTTNITTSGINTENVNLENNTNSGKENVSLEEIEPEETFGITGGVIGVNSKKNMIFASIILISILVIYAFVYYKRNNKIN